MESPERLVLHDQISDGDGLGDGVSANLAVLLTFDLLPRKALSRCSRTIHTMMRVPLNVGYPPQMAESATMCRPNAIRSAAPFLPLRISAIYVLARLLASLEMSLP